MIIYKITHKLSGKSYIGQTIKLLLERWAEHCRTKSHCKVLNSAILKYGKEAFSIEKVAEYSNQEDLNNAEEYYVDFYNSLAPNGYNLRAGGGSKGKHSVETIERMSNSRMGNKNPMFGRTGTKHHNFGKKHSAVSLAKMSISHKGNTAHLGKPHSEKTKKQMSIDRKGTIVSEKTRNKLSLANSGINNPFYGKKHTLETIDKIRKTKLANRTKARE